MYLREFMGNHTMTNKTKTFLSLIICSFLALLPAVARAQEENSAVGKKNVFALKSSSYSWQDFERLWEERRFLMQKSKDEAADQLIDKALAMK